MTQSLNSSFILSVGALSSARLSAHLKFDASGARGQSRGLVKAQGRVTLLEHAPAAQVAGRFRERVLVMVLDDEHAARAQQRPVVRAELGEHREGEIGG